MTNGMENYQSNTVTLSDTLLQNINKPPQKWAKFEFNFIENGAANVMTRQNISKSEALSTF